MDKIVFATLLTPANAPRALLLIESLREFGGLFATRPVLALVPAHAGALPAPVLEKLQALAARPIPFDMQPALHTFPLAAVPAAAGNAEAEAGSAEWLAWMLPDTLVLNPPAAFDLPTSAAFAYRPVHHTLIGSLYDRPPDAFWNAVYHHCATPLERLFPMQSCVRDHIIRPYFNAGLLVVRPELGLLRAWNRHFTRLALHPDFEPFYQQDERFAVFMHQAVLSALVPALLEPSQMLELPESCNYPAHLHADYPAPYRPASLSSLITCRYENFAVLQGALDAGLFDEPQDSWLRERLAL